ncbi:hypothetical protein [Bradyrhizobium sp. Ai1a-2]|uniref:hypothetical protein n=1 Tax=Bradyrhizobium sp. Ai1a-2 TaxID=196490 RepID=UPI00041C6131|nr:hypothetical protein [Bradyrhizobium sp. Ai1a-2]
MNRQLEITHEIAILSGEVGFDAAIGTLSRKYRAAAAVERAVISAASELADTFGGDWHSTIHVLRARYGGPLSERLERYRRASVPAAKALGDVCSGKLDHPWADRLKDED